jgi:transposase
VSRFDLTFDPKVAAARRVEVITGGGGRRHWSDAEKARAIEESLAPDAVVSQVARRHGLTPQQLFTWRREARRKAEENQSATLFVPAVVETPASPLYARAEAPGTQPNRAPVMEVALGGAHIWIWRDADIEMTTAVLGVLNAFKASGAK